MSIKVSVIVPVYNVEKYIKRCIDSLIEQKFDGIEIIIVDDGSTDSSSEICDDYADKYAYVTVVHKKNEGLGMARNSGLSIAKGEYIAFVDSDDYLAPHALTSMYEYAKKYDADTVLGRYKRVWDDGRIEEGQHPLENVLYDTREEILKNVLLNMLGSPKEYHDDIYLMMSVWMGIYSRRILVNNNIKFCSERDYISEDLIFDLDYYPCARRVYISDCDFYFYCENNSSLTLSYKKDRYEKNKILFKEIERKVTELNMDAQERLARSFLGRARQCIYSEAKYNKMLEALREIDKICCDTYLQQKISFYPMFNYSFGQKLFSVAIKNRMKLLLYYVCKILK